MKKGSKLLAIAFLFVLMVCFTVMGAMVAVADTQGSNLTPWGDAEGGEAPLTAVSTEKFGGEKSFEISAQTQIRIQSPAVDGSLYKGTLKVKGAAADTEFQLVDTATSQMVNGSWDYAYLGWEKVVVGTEWTEYTFNLCFRYDEAEKAL